MSTEDPVEITPLHIKIMVKIYKIRTKTELTLSQIAREIGFHPTDPTFQKVARHLVHEGILEFKNSVGRYNFYQINKKLLDREIYNSNYFQEVVSPYIKARKPLEYNF